MAELGSIDVVDSNRGVQPIGDTGQLSALRAATNVLATVAEEGVKASVASSLEEQAQSDLEDALDVQAALDAPIAISGDASEEAKFIAEMTKLEAIASQGGSATARTLAKQRLQSVLREKSRSFPWARDAIVAEGQFFANTSPAVAALNNLTVANTVAQERAQERRKQIEDRAYGSIGSGGLGISTRLQFGTQSFANEFVALDNQATARARNNLQLEANKADTGLSDFNRAAAISAVVQGKGSNISAVIRDNFNEHLRPVLVELKKGNAANPQIVNDWNNVGRHTVNLRLLSAMNEIEKEFNEQWATGDRTGDVYKGSLAEKNQLVERLTVLKDALTGEVTTAAKLFEAEAEAFSWNLVNTNPYLKTLNALKLRLGDEYIQTIEQALGRENLTFQDDLSSGVLSELEGIFNFDKSAYDTMYRGGQLEITPDATSQEVQRVLERNLNSMDRPFGIDRDLGTDEIARGAYKHNLIELTKFNVLEKVDATYAAQLMSSFNTGVGFINNAYRIGQADPEVVNATVSQFASPDFVKMVKAAGINNSNQVNAMGETAIRFLSEQYRVSDKAQEVRNKYVTILGSKPLRDYLSLNTDDFVSDGAVMFSLDEAKLRADLKRFYNRNVGAIESDMSEAIELTKQLSQTFTQLIRADANGKFARSYTSNINRDDAKPPYGQSLLELGLDSLFNFEDDVSPN